MTESALVFASIIVGLAITNELVNLHRLLQARSRVRWDWATPALALVVLMTLVQIWWLIAQPAEGPMTIGRFLPALIELILLFLLASAVLPDEVPAEGIDLRDYYAANRAYIWSLYSAALGWAILGKLIAGVAARAPLFRTIGALIPDLIVVGLMVSLIVVRKRWWHAAVLLVLMLGPVGWLSRSLN